MPEGFKLITKTILITIIIFGIGWLILFIISHIIAEPIKISEEQENILKSIYGENILNGTKFYAIRSLLIEIPPSHVFFDKVYLNWYWQYEQKSENFNLNYRATMTLIHEMMHVYQIKKNLIKTAASSSISLIKSFLSTGSKNSAYQYSLNQENYNVEQEAQLITDYYGLILFNEDIYKRCCLECTKMSLEEIKTKLKEKTRIFLEEYK